MSAFQMLRRMASDDLPLNDAALNLVDLTIRMLHEAFNLELAHNIQYVGKSRALHLHERLTRLEKWSDGAPVVGISKTIFYPK